MYIHAIIYYQLIEINNILWYMYNNASQNDVF